MLYLFDYVPFNIQVRKESVSLFNKIREKYLFLEALLLCEGLKSDPSADSL